MREKILDFLKRKEGYTSGDQLASRLGITRQALWKHIRELKTRGYDIVAVPHLGYRLISAPDRLFSFEVTQGLDTRFIGRKIYYFDSLSSTMNIAMQLGLKGDPSGTVVLAESQTRGRGRLGRQWLSPKYKGIYLSLILRPKILPAGASIFTLLAAVSVCEAIKETVGLETRIKWPNDIFVGNKKLGGILTELNAEMDKINFVIIGIGLNVNNDKKTLISTSTSLSADGERPSTPLRTALSKRSESNGRSRTISSATSLKEQKKENINRITLVQEILRRIETNYSLLENNGAEPIIEKWRQHNITLGKRVKVYCQKEHIEGEAQDIDKDGGLLIRNDSGLTQKVMAGDVVHCR